MKVLVLPAQDSAGSAFYRLTAPATVLIERGHDVTVAHADKNPLELTLKDGNVVEVSDIDYDVVVTSRPMGRADTQATKILQSRGIAVVVELDDDFWSIHPNAERNDGWRNKDNNEHHLKSTLYHADLVTVSTPHLATAVPVPRDKVRVLRNCVPLFYTELERDPELRAELGDKLTVGWTGTPGTHHGDLEVLRYSVRDVIRQTGAQFFTIGDERTASVLGFDDGEAIWSPWIHFSNGNYIKSVKNFDIGIAPLGHTPFNYSKSNLKGLEYAGLGIPFIASDVPEYEWLETQGAGRCARHEGEWRRFLRDVLTSPQARFEQAASGREAARRLSYEANADSWWDAWTEALERRRKNG